MYIGILTSVAREENNFIHHFTVKSANCSYQRTTLANDENDEDKGKNRF
jgi:hypothetical protein